VTSLSDEVLTIAQTSVTITSPHAKVHFVQAAMRELAGFFKTLARTAEQLGLKERISLIAKHAYRKLVASAPPLPTPKFHPGAEMESTNCRF